MTEPDDDSDLTTRTRGESPDIARGVILAAAPASTRDRGESLESMTRPVPTDPDEELTHDRSESSWTARVFVGLTEPREPMTKNRGEVPSTVSMRVAKRASEPRWPQP